MKSEVSTQMTKTKKNNKNWNPAKTPSMDAGTPSQHKNKH
jgi:hypothetical protein